MTLPAGWRRGLTRKQQRAIVAVERRYASGDFDFLPTRHKGYVRIRLPGGHPFAVKHYGYWKTPAGRWHWGADYAARMGGCRRWELERGRPGYGGWQYLHRYLAMSEAGRVLYRHEHAHHRDGAPKDTTDRRLIEVMEEADHGRFHWGRWVSCGPHVGNCEGCQGDGCESCGGTGAILDRRAAAG